jgi:hypothetical protein
MFLAEVNDHLLHSDGDMSRYFIDKEHKSCLDTDEDTASHLETIQDQRSMSDGPVIKPTKRYVSNDLLTKEQLISVQKKELVLPCSKSFSVEEAENVNVCYFMKD